MNGLDLLVIGAAVAAAVALLYRQALKPVKLVRPAEAVKRDKAPVLPPVAVFQMPLDPANLRVITGGHPDPVAKSEQQEAYDRWLVSDEADPHKLPGASAFVSINEPAWKDDPRIAQRVRQRRQQIQKPEKR
jgi:hypothetical protein